MNQLFGGSICLTDMIEKAKQGHSSFTKATNGKVYCNILTWLNEEKDKFGNVMSHQLSSSKDMRDKEEKFYIGNSRPLESNQPVSAKDIPTDDFNNIPVREVKKEHYSNVSGQVDDLPF